MARRKTTHMADLLLNAEVKGQYLVTERSIPKVRVPSAHVAAPSFSAPSLHSIRRDSMRRTTLLVQNPVNLFGVAYGPAFLQVVGDENRRWPQLEVFRPPLFDFL